MQVMCTIFQLQFPTCTVIVQRKYQAGSQNNPSKYLTATSRFKLLVVSKYVAIIVPSHNNLTATSRFKLLVVSKYVAIIVPSHNTWH